jgi:SAM-dependent methyltransferase
MSRGISNYEFCANFAAEHGGRVLDYGCGKGQIVELLLAKGIDAYGCDVFYEGGSYRSAVSPDLVDRGRIAEMHDRIPFPDSHFDIVLNNQVMEHVPDLDLVLREIHRVMKPGAVLLSLFPDRSVWREGHREVPFLHWFPKGNLRVYYAFAFRLAGRGAIHQETPKFRWAQESCDWIDRWCYYRSYNAIRAAYSRYFSRLEHIESRWFDARKPHLSMLPKSIKVFASRKGAGLVFQCRKPALDQASTVQAQTPQIVG